MLPVSISSTENSYFSHVFTSSAVRSCSAGACIVDVQPLSKAMLARAMNVRALMVMKVSVDFGLGVDLS
jgi:hypothetical protein